MAFVSGRVMQDSFSAVRPSFRGFSTHTQAMDRRSQRFTVTVLLMFAAFAQGAELGVRGAVPGNLEVTTERIHCLVVELQAELELIRAEMGKPSAGSPVMKVSDAAPREVYYQALTLLQKSDRLAFEHTRERIELPTRSAGEIESSDVHLLVLTALQRIQRVKIELGIPETVETVTSDRLSTPSDVYMAILSANRQLNVLFDYRYSPSDVFQQVTVAVSYAARLLGAFPGVETIPPAPGFERRKRPAEVYARLLRCFNDVRKLFASAGMPILHTEASTVDPDQITPSDVYDLASLLVSELAHLHQFTVQPEPVMPYHPGRKLPAHVYQRAGMLVRQLELLNTLTVEEPKRLGWTGRS